MTNIKKINEDVLEVTDENVIRVEKANLIDRIARLEDDLMKAKNLLKEFDK